MRKIGNRVYDKTVYEQTYDIITGKYNCTCKGFTILGKCRHINPEWKKKVEQLLKEKEIFEGD